MPTFEEEIRQLISQQQAGQQGTGIKGTELVTPRSTGLGHIVSSERAVKALSSVPSVQSLLTRVQQRGETAIAPVASNFPLPPAGPLLPPAPGGPPDTDFIPPTGPGGTPGRGPWDLLSGGVNAIGGAFDFLSKLFLAPAFLGTHVDKNTGITSKLDSPDPNLDPISQAMEQAQKAVTDVLPGLSILDLRGHLRRSFEVQKDFGINPFEQMAQAFDFSTASKARRAVQSQEGAELMTAVRAGLQATAGTAGGIVQAAGGMKGLFPDTFMYELIRDNKNALQAIRETPQIVEEQARWYRNERLKTAAGEPEVFSDLLDENINPFWILLGGPLVSAGKWFGAAVAKAPIVSPITKGLIGRAQDLRGSWLFRPTIQAEAHNVSRDVEDALSGIVRNKSIESNDIGGLLREIDNFRLTPYEQHTGPWYTHSESVAKPAWNTLQEYQDAVEEFLAPFRKAQSFREQFPADNPLSSDEVVKSLSNYLEGIVKKELTPKKSKRGFFENLLQQVEKPTEAYGRYWRPLTLAPRMVYHLNNLFSGLAMEMQYHGLDSLSNYKYIQAAEDMGLAAEGSAEALFGAKSTLVGAAPRYTQEAFGESTGSVANLPEKLAKLPLGIGRVLGASTQLGHNIERFLKNGTYAGELYRQLGSNVSAVKNKYTAASETLTSLLDGVENAKQLEGRISEQLDGVFNARNYAQIDDPELKVLLGKQLKDLHTPGEPMDIATVGQAYDNLMQEVKTIGLLTRAAAKGIDLYGRDADDVSRLAFALDHPSHKDLTARYSLAAKELSEWDSNIQELVNHSLRQAAKASMAKGRKSLASATRDEELRLQVYQGLRSKYDDLIRQWDEGLRFNMNQTFFREMEALDTQITNGLIPRAAGYALKRTKYQDWVYNQRLPHVNNMQARYSNIHNIIVDSIIKGRNSKKTEDLLKQWHNTPDQYPLPQSTIARLQSIKSRRIGQGIEQREFENLMKQAGFTGNETPGIWPDFVGAIEQKMQDQIAQVSKAKASFYGRAGAGMKRVKKGQLKTFEQFQQELGVNPAQVLEDMKQAELVARDLSANVAKQVQMDYSGDSRNIDRIMRLAFPFHFWQTRYMLFQVKQAARNPQQALALGRTIKAWQDANKDKPFWEKMSVQLLTLNPGTPEEIQVNFNPSNLLFPAGGVIGEVVNAADPEKAQDLQDGFSLLSNFFGGSFYPYIPVMAAAVGHPVEGGPPATLGDMVKTLAPPITWARQALTSVTSGIPGAEGATLAAMTDKEIDQVIRAIQDDVNAQVIGPVQGKQAAVSLRQGSPNDLAAEYLLRENPERFMGSMVRAQVGPLSTKGVPERLTNLAYDTLKSAKTSGEAQAVFEQYPGLSVNLAGKRGEALELAMINASAPTNPILRSMYYKLQGDRISQLTQTIDEQKGETARYKLLTASPESFESFQAAGGQTILPKLVNYWFKNEPLQASTQKQLAELYKSQSMGALEYEDWRDRILLNAYMQWTLGNVQMLKQSR